MLCNKYKESSRSCKKLHKVVPIKIWLEDPSDAVVTWAFMDEGSETSLCTFDFAQKLGAKLKNVNIQVCTNNGVSAVNQEIECLYIKGLDQGCATHGPRATIRPSRPVNVALDDGRTKKNFFLNQFI